MACPLLCSGRAAPGFTFVSFWLVAFRVKPEQALRIPHAFLTPPPPCEFLSMRAKRLFQKFFGFQIINYLPRHNLKFRIYQIHYARGNRVRNSCFAADSAKKFGRLHFQRERNFCNERRAHKLRSCFDYGKMLLRNVEHFRELRLREFSTFSEPPQIFAEKFWDVDERVHIKIMSS